MTKPGAELTPGLFVKKVKLVHEMDNSVAAAQQEHRNSNPQQD